MKKQKEEKKERGGGRRTRMCPLLLGATAMRWEKEPDAEEGGRRWELGARVSEGLEVGVVQAARTPGGPGGSSSVAALSLSLEASRGGNRGWAGWARPISKLSTVALALWATICLGLQSSSSC